MRDVLLAVCGTLCGTLCGLITGILIVIKVTSDMMIEAMRLVESKREQEKEEE